MHHRSPMDPRDRLWDDLVFPWCDWGSLLQLRAVCRGFRAQLAESRAWRSWTMRVAKLRFDERLLGWSGVLQAKSREEQTLAHCEAGRATLGPSISAERVSCALSVAGRVVVFCADRVLLVDLSTGVPAATVENVPNHMSAVTAQVVADRWMPFVSADDGRALLLDCLSGRVSEFAPRATARAGSITTSGVRFAYQCRQQRMLVLMDMAGDAGATSEVSRVALAHDAVCAFLCVGGCVLFDVTAQTMQLLDARGVVKRTIDPPAGFTFSDVRSFSGDADFVAVVEDDSRAVDGASGTDEEGPVQSQWRAAVVRISDGHCTAPFAVDRMAEILFTKGRVIAETSFDYHLLCVFDALTGHVVADNIVCDALNIDTSGAVVWLGSEAGRGPFASRDVLALRDAVRRPIFDPDAVHAEPVYPMYPSVMDFRYGVLLAACEPDVVRVVRFDTQPQPEYSGIPP